MVRSGTVGSEAAKWSRALLSLGVTIPVALAPFLGKLHVPGFDSLLTLMPEECRPAPSS
jgi:hypothetical protein